MKPGTVVQKSHRNTVFTTLYPPTPHNLTREFGLRSEIIRRTQPPWLREVARTMGLRLRAPQRGERVE